MYEFWVVLYEWNLFLILLYGVFRGMEILLMGNFINNVIEEVLWGKYRL